MAKPTPEEIKQWIVIDKKSISATAKHFGCNVGSLSQLVKRLGIVSEHSDKAQRKELDGNELLIKYRNGDSLHKLHIEYKRPVRAIKNAIVKADPDIVFRTRDDALRPSQLNNPIELEKLAGEAKTARAIARELGVKESTVVNAYKRTNLIRHKKNIVIIPQADLEYLYVDQKLSSIEIAGRYGTSIAKVCCLLKKYNIKARNFNYGKDSKYDKLNDRQWLFQQYIALNLSIADISRLIGCGVGSVAYALRKLEIPIRSRDDVYNKLRDDDHGRKINVEYLGKIVQCDSMAEAEFLDFAKENKLEVERCDKNLTINSHIYRPDFISGNTIIEVKPKSQILGEANDRSDFIQQWLIATKSGYQFRAWDKQFYDDIVLTDMDKYYASAWDLIFNSSRECADWLLDFGFRGALRSHKELVSGLKKIDKLNQDQSVDVWDSSINAANVVWFMRHFHPHFFQSTHRGYKPVSSAFDLGNTSIVRQAVDKLWNKKTSANIHSLLTTISRDFVDFSFVSMFKPWVARAVYMHLLLEGDTIVDPCAGWGGRLLGTIGLPVIYKGYDINEKSVIGNKSMIKFVGSRRLTEVTVDQADSATIQFPESDLIFTSPPYQGLETYCGVSEDKTDLIIDNIFKQRSAKIVALNVSNQMSEMVMQIATSYRYKHRETLMMKTKQYMSMRNAATEPILIFDRR